VITKDIDTTVCANAIPFTWNGTPVTGAGDYPFTTASAAGCDSTTTLHVTIAAVIKKVIDTTVCENAIPFNWNSIPVTGAGDYPFTTASAAGCDSTTTLHVTVAAVITKDIDTTVCSNAIPFSWNGINVTGTNDYPYTTTGSSGCDSTTTLHVTIAAVITKVIDTTVCSNAIPFSWNGINVTGAGDYPYTTTGSSGCDSTTTLHVTIAAVITKVIDSTVCANAIPFSWNGINVTGAGDYPYTTTGSSGCDSTTTLHVTIAPVITKVIDTTVCANAIPFTWNGQSVTGAGDYPFTTSSAAGCDSTTTLHVTLAPVIKVTMDTTVCVNAVPFIWNGISVTGTGDYPFTTASAAGCDSTTTLHVTVASVINITLDTTVCTSAIPFTWNDIPVTGAGDYPFSATSASGCDSVTTLHVTLAFPVTVTVDTTVCTNAVPFTWNGQSIVSPGHYTFATTSSSGCDSTITLNVSIKTPPTPTISGPASVCQNNPGNVYSTQPGELNYTWTVVGGTITAGGGVTDNTATITWTSSGVQSISVNYSNGGCSALTATTLNVTVDPAPTTFHVTGGGLFCSSSGAVIGLDGSEPGIRYELLLGGVSVSTLPITGTGGPINFPAQFVAGTYTIIADDPVSFCTSIMAGNAIITFNASPVKPSISHGNTSVCDGGSVILIDPSVNSNSIQWNLNGSPVPGATNNIYSATVGGSYTVTETNAKGCSATSVPVNVVINPILNVSIDTTVCINSVPFSWNGINVTGAGVYPFTTASAAGCDSTTTLHVTVAAVITKDIDTTVCSNAIPFSWNGINVTGAGDYPFTTASAAGCDSTTTLHVTIAAVITRDIDSTVCANAIPFSWNGINVTGAGDYPFTTASASGCDSTTTLHVSVTSVITKVIDTTVCSNVVPFNWNGLSVTGAGDYPFTTASAAGCDSTTTLHVTIAAVITKDVDTTVCANAIPFSWNGINVTGAGDYPFTTASAAGCDSTTTLHVTVASVITKDIYTTVCANAIPFSWNGINVTGAGDYPFTTASASGCDSTTTLHVTVAAVITKDIDTTVCANAIPFSWNGINVTGAGDYPFTTASAAGCDSTTTLHVTVASVITKDIDTTVCANAIPFSWNGINVTGAGDYPFTTASAAGCDSTTTLHVTITSIHLSVTDPAGVCAPATVDITNPSITAGSDAGLNFTYWNDAAATSPLNSPNAVSVSGVYYIKASNSGGCSSIAPVKVTINKPPTIVMSGSSIICSGANAILTVTLTGTAPFRFSYSDGVATYNVGPVSSSTYQFSVEPETTTAYTINSVTDAYCSSTGNLSSATITVMPAIAPVRYPTMTVNANTATQLNARNLGGNYTYQWAPPVGLTAYNTINPVFNYDKPTEYKITITSEQGCSVTDTLLVKINPIDAPPVNEDILVPKAWTPNGDGQNDLLRPILINIRELKYFRIFNRWGELVYETNASGQGWNGIYKGKPQAMDTYTWTAEGIGVSGAVIKRTGNSVLLR
ncbi:MAG TPA: T9SS type B sorting domain-containing protein, partial [Chitinophagaceae bacterium]|nr:T9SS type B sorting domain-containing protein [Chitinophagaceae bacterium]